MAKAASEMTAETVLSVLDLKLSDVRGDLSKFSDRLQKDPAEAFTWGDDAVRAAARFRVYSHFQSKIKDGISLADMLAVARREALRGALWPKHSTSALMNLVHEEETSAWASLVQDFGGGLS